MTRNAIAFDQEQREWIRREELRDHAKRHPEWELAARDEGLLKAAEQRAQRRQYLEKAETPTGFDQLQETQR